MTKQDFTKKCADLPNFGLMAHVAKLCVEHSNEDGYVHDMVYDFLNKDSRQFLIKNLTTELLDALKLFVCDNIFDESDSVFKILERRRKTISQLRVDVKNLKRQIKK
jgi:hypothetical protein